MPTKFPDIVLVSTIDFFYPLVLDPYLQGKIGCANVLSDLYAMGISNCDNMLMVLAASLDMDPKHRHIVTQEMLRGFADLAKEAGTVITGGQTVLDPPQASRILFRASFLALFSCPFLTEFKWQCLLQVLNPWPIIGGVAQSVEKKDAIIMPEHAVAGDLLILTKPLGTQLAVNLSEWLRDCKTRPADKNRYAKVADIISPEQAVKAFKTSERSMCRLNRTGAALMHKHDAHACTDVTGFGILGHAQNLVVTQNADVDFVIHTMPVVRDMEKIDGKVHDFKLLAGFSAETSGGLLIALPADKAEAFCKEIEEIDGEPAWIIGDVIAGTKKSRMAEGEITVIPVD